jgi:hypothetical protein
MGIRTILKTNYTLEKPAIVDDDAFTNNVSNYASVLSKIIRH